VVYIATNGIISIFNNKYLVDFQNKEIYKFDKQIWLSIAAIFLIKKSNS
jgi:hypothetical protein